MTGNTVYPVTSSRSRRSVRRFCAGASSRISMRFFRCISMDITSSGDALGDGRIKRDAERQVEGKGHAEREREIERGVRLRQGKAHGGGDRDVGGGGRQRDEERGAARRKAEHGGKCRREGGGNEREVDAEGDERGREFTRALTQAAPRDEAH